jgi:polysaccharide deacetylase family protein (PEP-CTERM system associated)
MGRNGGAQRVMHCLSIDVEGFVEGMLESFSVPDRCFGSIAEASEIDVNVDATLDLFDQLGIKGTFFILGRIAERQPSIVKKIADGGHEIASHSHFHRRIYNQTRATFSAEAAKAKKLLEDITGRQVLGFRAPDFSIRPDTLWALDELRDAGYFYDASLTPTDIHDVYGNKGIPQTIHRLDNGLYEFPASTFKMMGKTLPFGGGGYMRLYPVWLSRWLLRRADRRSCSCMLYMHPYEIGPHAPHIDGISGYRRFRHYYNIEQGASRLRRVLRGFNFATAISILQSYLQSDRHE